MGCTGTCNAPPAMREVFPETRRNILTSLNCDQTNGAKGIRTSPHTSGVSTGIADRINRLLWSGH